MDVFLTLILLCSLFFFSLRKHLNSDISGVTDQEGILHGYRLEKIKSKETQGWSSCDTLSGGKKYCFLTLITSSGRAVITAHTDTAGYTNIRVSHKSYGLLYHKCSLEINIKKQMKQKIKWKL